VILALDLSLALLFLIGTFFLTALNAAFSRLSKKGSIEQLDKLGDLFIYRKLHRSIFQENELEILFFATSFSASLGRYTYAFFSAIFLVHVGIFPPFTGIHSEIHYFGSFIVLLAFTLLLILFGDVFPRLSGSRSPEKTIRFCAPSASFFLFLFFPFTIIFQKLCNRVSDQFLINPLAEPVKEMKERIIELIQESETYEALGTHDKKLIESVITFRGRLAKEVMVPRVEVFSLAEDTAIADASKALEDKGMSRVPVYQQNIDNITGLLMAKDILSYYNDYPDDGEARSMDSAPIKTLIKPVIYTPETKKISELLQEFRQNQMHMAIVVDEYGGTAGIVTIEDVLEELVGEIADEYDKELPPFQFHHGGSWTVDAKMSILDIEDELGLSIPQDGDYDTIGGYIFHRAGAIPSEGFTIQHDDFEIKILSSNDRRIKEILLTDKSEGDDKLNQDS
jgi:putative hemolysin